MRKKLILLLLLMLTIILTLVNMNKGGKFIKDPSQIQIVTTKSFKESKDIIANNFKKDTKAISGVSSKFQYVDAKEIKSCNKEGSATVISIENGYNIVAIENNNNYEYYKERGSANCELIGKIQDVNFTENVVEAYANDAIYTSFESNSDFEISGMVKVKDDKVTPIDTLDKHYTNPIAFSGGVLMIQNNKNVMAFDSEDKVIWQQNNANNSRQVLAINVVKDSLFLIVKNNNQYNIEGYNIEDQESITKAKPQITYNVSKYIGRVESEITTKRSDSYVSFTTNSNSLLVANDLSKIVVLEKYNTALGFNGYDFITKKDEGYYVFKIDNNTYESFGNIKALNFKFLGNTVIFEVLNNHGKSEYISFSKR